MQILTESHNTAGDIDALYLAAAVRIFAEWRIIRLVPEGYKRYAMGVNLGRRDLISNLVKVEDAVHDWIDSVTHADFDDDDANSLCSGQSSRRFQSPTVRDLLLHEIDNGVHDCLPRLQDKSAATGILWITRQLDYHKTMMEKSLQVPKVYPTTKAAVEAAYKEVYGDYHGWTIQQIFKQSFQAAPEFQEILAVMQPLQPFYEDDVTVCSTETQESETTESDQHQDLTQFGDADEDSFQYIPTQERNVLDERWHHIQSSLCRFNCFCVPNQDQCSKTPLVSIVDPVEEDSVVLQFSSRPVTKLPTKQLSQEDEMDLPSMVSSHVKTMSSLIDDNLRHIITDLNMNDPTKA